MLMTVVMKWFTREWASGDLSDEEWDARALLYEAHLARIQPQLVNGAARLSDGVNLHDGKIHAFELRADGVLRFRALIGDLEAGYEFVELDYREAEIRLDPGVNLKALRLLDPRTEILQDEVDIASDGRFAHRVLLWPEGEYEVLFSGLTERRESRDRT